LPCMGTPLRPAPVSRLLARRALARELTGQEGVWALELKYNPVNTRATFFYRKRVTFGVEISAANSPPLARRPSDQLYPPRHKLRHLSAIICSVERWPNRIYTHAGVRPCRASLSPTTTCRPSPSSAITPPCPSSSASSKSSGSSPRAWPPTTSPASPASPAPP